MKNKKNNLNVSILIASAIFVEILVFFAFFNYGKFSYSYIPEDSTKFGGELEVPDTNIGKKIIMDNEITKETGLNKIKNNYIFRGSVKNNYLEFNNLTWRIIEISGDKSVKLVLDNYINMLPYGKVATNFKNSEISSYLKTTFLPNLDKEKLVKTFYCDDVINNVKKISCKTKLSNDAYVTLLELNDLNNTIVDGNTFLVNKGERILLNNHSSNRVWVTNGAMVSETEPINFFEIKPVITLSNKNEYKSGDGTRTNPYKIVENDNLKIGTQIKLGNDIWQVFDTRNGLKLSLKGTLPSKYRFSTIKKEFDINDKNSLAKYLNTTYYESLPYKEYIVENDYDIGNYKNDLKDIEKKAVRAKVGVLNILDIKINPNSFGYFTSTAKGEYIVSYQNPIKLIKRDMFYRIKPVITIDEEMLKEFTLIDGIYQIYEEPVEEVVEEPIESIETPTETMEVEQ